MIDHLRRYEIRGFPGWWTVWSVLYEDTDENGRHYTMWKRIAGPFLRRRHAVKVTNQ
jgi:hypothetical protein